MVYRQKKGKPESPGTVAVDCPEIDPGFASARFMDETGHPLEHRRLEVRAGESARFIVRVNVGAGLPGKMVFKIEPGATSLSSDAAVTQILFDGPQRILKNGSEALYPEWGVEQTMLYEDGKFKSWYHGAPDQDGDYWNTGAVRYAESTDGIHWKDQGKVIGNDPPRGCPFVYHLLAPTAAGEPAGYYLAVGRNHQFGFDLFYSSTGLPGTWTQSNGGKLIVGLGPTRGWDGHRTGNNTFFYDRETQQWNFFYEAADPAPAELHTGPGWFSWRGGLATGPSLTELRKYAGNPIFSRSRIGGRESVAGGFEIKKVGQRYFALGHSEDASPNNPAKLTPTSNAFWSADRPEGPWKMEYWMTRIYSNLGNAGQVADPSWMEKDGETLMWYESQKDQSTLLPDLSMSKIPLPIERWTNPKVWTAKGEDLTAEGWKFYEDAGEWWPDTLMRKVSNAPNPALPVSVIVKTGPHQVLTAERAAGPLDESNTFTFYARADQANRRFTPLGLYGADSEYPRFEIQFGRDGAIYYQNAKGMSAALRYIPRAWYKFEIREGKTGYSLRINDRKIAQKIPYGAQGRAFFVIDQEEHAVGYVGALVITKPVPGQEDE